MHWVDMGETVLGITEHFDFDDGLVWSLALFSCFRSLAPGCSFCCGDQEVVTFGVWMTNCR